MTRTRFRELFPKASTVLDSPEFHSALDCLRETCPFLEDKERDSHQTIRNEAKIVGWNECLDALRAIWKERVEIQVPKTPEHYRDPNPSKIKT